MHSAELKGTFLMFRDYVLKLASYQYVQCGLLKMIWVFPFSSILPEVAYIYESPLQGIDFSLKG